jgi:hypothetical protein
MYFTCRGRGLKIQEKSLTDKHVYKWKPSDGWHRMSDTDYAFNWIYCTHLRTVLKSIHLCSLFYANAQFNYSIIQQDIEVRYIPTEDYSLLEVTQCRRIDRYMRTLRRNLMPQNVDASLYYCWGYIATCWPRDTQGPRLQLFLDFLSTAKGTPEEYSISKKPQLVLSYFHIILHS